MTDPAGAAQRLRAYLNACPDAASLGSAVEYDPKFTAANGRPAGVYALDRADLAAVLDEHAENEGIIRALRRQRDEAEAERDRLAAALREHGTCQTCSHERHEHGHDHVIRAQYCGRCPVGRDVHDFHPEEQP